jgi:hypothetical protein
MSEDARKQLKDLLERMSHEPPSAWDFTGEYQKAAWLLSQVTSALKTQFRVSLERAAARARERTRLRRSRRTAPRASHASHAAAE